ncbi:MAG: cytochrome bc complex cytochrome b subunit, partial [Candidatus Zixiibacteriota bacterium]
VRSIHAWSANLLILALFINMFSTFLLKAYRKPRELTWMTGFALFGICLGLGFTGYLLPWNELAYFATKIGTEMVTVVPFVGDILKHFLRGGDNVTGVTLQRFFAFHIWILPLLLAALVGIHLLLVQMLGMSRPLSEEVRPKRSFPFLPHFALRDLNVWLLFLALLVTLSFYFPAHLGEPADPLSPTPIGIRPEWYFLFMFQSLKLLPPHILGLEGELVGIVFFGIVGVFILLSPFLDRRSSKGKPSNLYTSIGWLMIAFVAGMTIWGW